VGEPALISCISAQAWQGSASIGPRRPYHEPHLILDVRICAVKASSVLRAPSRYLRGIFSGAMERLVEGTPSLTLKRPVRSQNYPLVPYLVGPDTYPMNDLPTFLGMVLHIRRRTMSGHANTSFAATPCGSLTPKEYVHISRLGHRFFIE